MHGYRPVLKRGVAMAIFKALVAACALVAAAGVANADNRVAAYTHGPHVSAPGVAAQTTPGQCATGYRPAMNKGRQACVSCPTGYNYTVHNTYEACVHCNAGYEYYVNANPQICAGCPAGYNYNFRIGACFPKP
jgi:uncharacterized low-complexity protein